MVLSLLLARANLCESPCWRSFGDFLRDFRGDTVHPTTMRLLDESLNAFAACSYSEVRTATFAFGNTAVTHIDFEHVPNPHVAMVPQ